VGPWVHCLNLPICMVQIMWVPSLEVWLYTHESSIELCDVIEIVVMKQVQDPTQKSWDGELTALVSRGSGGMQELLKIQV